ncbi:MAG: LytR/AlgR family response regulator transcription factor [Christensenellales bacterium]|jgi:DNA-binding LytR/AlgR family response regulator
MPHNLNIAVCEDMPRDMERLCAQIAACGLGVQIQRFQSGEAFLDNFSAGRYHLVFLDIYMQGMTGVDVAKALRASDADCIIVFTTTSHEHALEGYQVNALQYLLKPTQDEEVARVLEKAVSLLKPKNEPFITVLSDKQKYDIPLHTILYVEVHNRICRIHTTKETLPTYASIGGLEQMLPTPPFLRCHQAYIVNMDHVACIKQDFHMKNDDRVYIRQREYHKIRKIYLRYLVQDMKEMRYEH